MAFFDEGYYIKTKLAQLTAAGAVDANGEPFNQFTLRQAIADARMTPEEHYKAYGRTEGLNPNAYFNEKEYLHAKLAALQGDPETAAFWADRSINDLQAVIQSSGMTPAEHYEQYGSKETTKGGHLLNPSNAFDANAYVAAKLAQLQSDSNPNAEERAKWAGKTVADLVKELQDENISPVTHYQNYGASEASTAKVPLVQTVPVAQRMPNDPARETITGEIVPGNYNPATPAPGEAKPAPVAKPADMGGKADETVSPPVHVPAKPLPVPGDANYTPPPDGLVDSNDKPVLPPASSDGNWVVVNPDGGGTIIKPDGTPGGTYPPGSMDPANPVIPDSKPDTGGDSKPGGDDPVTPPQEAGKTVVLTGTDEQHLILGTGNDSVDGVVPQHLAPRTGPNDFVFGYIDGKAGNDSVTLENDSYDLHAQQLRSIENVILKTDSGDFTWRIGDTDFPTGAYQSKAETAITATSLDEGAIRVDKPTGAALDLSITTGNKVDNVLVRLGQNGKTNITTAGGNDRVVLVGGFDRAPDANSVNDTGGFGDITDACTTTNGAWVIGTLDFGAGTNALKIYGNVNLTGATLKADTGSVAMEFLGPQNIATMTTAQFALLTANAQKIAASSGVSWLNVSGGSSDTIDLSKVSIAETAHVNFVLDNGIKISGTPDVIGSGANKGSWGYRILDAGTYTGTVGNEDLFEVDENALAGGNYSGNSATPGENDRFVLQLTDHTGATPLAINAGGADGIITGFNTLEISAATSIVNGVLSIHDTNIFFGAGTAFGSVSSVLNSDDTLDIANLTGTPTVEMGAGDDELTGVKDAHFAADNSKCLDGGDGYDRVTLTDEVSKNFSIVAGQLKNFEIVQFSAGNNVSWTLGDGDYSGPDLGTTSVGVNANAITGALTFDASAETESTVLFAVTSGSGADMITGGSGNDYIAGGAGNDTLTGGSGDDNITGEAGADELDGGAGNDTYVYTTLAHSLASAFDTVEFDTGDKIGVTLAQYTAIKTNNTTGLVKPADFVSTDNGLAADISAAFAVAPSTSLLANGAALVTITGNKSHVGTYLILNNDNTTFDAGADAVIKIVGTIPGAGDFTPQFTG